MQQRRFFFTLITLVIIGNGISYAQPVSILPTPVVYYNFNSSITSATYTTNPNVHNANLTTFKWVNTAGENFTGDAGNTTTTPDDNEVSTSNSLSIDQSSLTSPYAFTYVLTFKVAAGDMLSITNYSFWMHASGTGPSNWSMTISSTSTATTTMGSNTTTDASGGDHLFSNLGVDNQVNGLTGTVTITLSLTGGTSTSGVFRLDDFTLYGSVVSTCAAGAAPGTKATALAFSGTQCYQTTLGFTIGNGSNRIVVAKEGSAPTGTPVSEVTYSANSVFGAGSILNQGEYVVYNGTGNSVTVTALLANTKYYFEVFEYNGACPGYGAASTSANVTTSNAGCGTTCPYVESILINDCDTTTGNGNNEGLDEYFVVKNGNQTLDITNTNFNINFPSTAVNPGPYGYSKATYGVWIIGDSPYYRTKENGACANLLSYSIHIPANATIIVFPSNAPARVENFDASSICAGASKPIYTVFCDNTYYNGRFDNSSGATTRTLAVSYTTGCTSNSVNYIPNSTSDNDGDYTTYSSAGGAPLAYSNLGTCSTVLPIKLLSFTASPNYKVVNIAWRTASEINNKLFTVEKTSDGLNWVFVANVNGAGNSTQIVNYNSVDESPYPNTSYYRLKQTDYDGNSSYSNVVTVNIDPTLNIITLIPNPANNKISVTFNSLIEGTSTLTVYDLAGRAVESTQLNTEKGNNTTFLDVSAYYNGMYFVTITNEVQRFSSKLVVSHH